MKEQFRHATATVIEIQGYRCGRDLEWVRSGRIEIAGIEGLGIQCESCGIAITSGRFCVQCAVRMQQDETGLGAEVPKSAPRANLRSSGNSIMRRRRDD